MYTFPNFEPVSFMWGSNCCFLTCTQVSQEAGKVVWYSHLFKNFPHFVVIHMVEDFIVVNEAEVNVFLEFSCFLYDPIDVDNLISCSSTLSKFSLNTWKFLVHQLLKPSLENFQHFSAGMWNECNGELVWTFFGNAFLWESNENWSLQSCGQLKIKTKKFKTKQQKKKSYSNCLIWEFIF